MCRLLGVVSSETTEFRFSLHDAPKSLAVLSAEHPHGWGLAVHRRSEGWALQKNAVAAAECDVFRELAASARGELLLAHIRKRTVGPITVENTHPFHRGSWIFAHNGTIEDLGWFTERTSPERLREVEGQTDSERFFAWVLTKLDEMGDPDLAIRSAAEAALARPKLGAANFLLSNGRALWAFRAGRTLHVLERTRGDDVRERRSSPETHAELETPWSPRRHAFLVASERMTDEPWRELGDGTLLRIDGGERPAMTVLRGE